MLRMEMALFLMEILVCNTGSGILNVQKRIKLLCGPTARLLLPMKEDIQ